jgi:hypothetical protein
MRTNRTAAISLACLALLALAGCSNSPRSRVVLTPSGNAATQTASLGAGDNLGWHVRGMDATLAARNETRGARAATGE